MLLPRLALRSVSPDIHFNSGSGLRCDISRTLRAQHLIAPNSIPLTGHIGLRHQHINGIELWLTLDKVVFRLKTKRKVMWGAGIAQTRLASCLWASKVVRHAKAHSKKRDLIAFRSHQEPTEGTEHHLPTRGPEVAAPRRRGLEQRTAHRIIGISVFDFAAPDFIGCSLSLHPMCAIFGPDLPIVCSSGVVPVSQATQ